MAEREPEAESVKVRDRRIFGEDGEPVESRDAAPEEAAEPVADEPAPEIDFSTFVISLSTSAMYHLGVIPDPEGKAPETNLPMAKQTIDILAMLREKTQGNLSPEETQLLNHLLYDLRMRFVGSAKGR